MGIWKSLRRLAGKGKKSEHSNPARRHRKPRGLRMEQFEERTLMSISDWVPQGPAPIYDGETTNVGPIYATTGTYGNQVIGAIKAVVADPQDEKTLFVGTVNGGIWKTRNGTDPSPTWTPLTDAHASLSIGALAMHPGNRDVLVAGIGLWSDYGRNGGPLTGVLKTVNGGGNWTALDGSAGSGVSLVGRNVAAVAVRDLPGGGTSGNIIMVAVDTTESGLLQDTGIFRSTDGGNTFLQVSGAALPGGRTYDLVGDPINPAVFYTGVVGADQFSGQNGIYKTSDYGVTWSKVSSTAIDQLIVTGQTTNLKISVGKQNNVYAAIVNSTNGRDQLAGVYRSANGGTAWTAMDLPSTVDNGVTYGLNPSGQGEIHLSLQADPSNANIVYIGGDAQPQTGANSSIGAAGYTARLFRGDALQAAGSQWVHLTDSSGLGATGGGTLSSSAPHNDTRAMVVDRAGRLIEVDDGGIYVRTSPQNNRGDWVSINGNLQITEIVNIGYDTISNVIVGGSQDVGAAEQVTAGGVAWREVIKGDGGDVAIAVDDVSLVAFNQSYRYVSGNNLGYVVGQPLGNFQRRVMNADNTVARTEIPALVVIGANGRTFYQVDLAPNGVPGQYYTPIELNAINPARMVIAGYTSIFESTDRGDTLTNLGAVGQATAMIYGGYRAGAANAAVLWAISPNGVFLRTAAGGPLTKMAAYSGGTPRDIVVDTTDWTRAYVIDDSHVYVTANAGATWTDITGVDFKPTELRSLEFVASGGTGAVIVGDVHGVYASQIGKPGTWYELGSKLPNAPVLDMDYDKRDDVLVVGTQGRGAWKMTNASKEIFGIPELVTVVWMTDEQKDFSIDDKPQDVSPRELTLRFNENQILDTTTLGTATNPAGIILTEAGADGIHGTADDKLVPLGYINLTDKTNEVVLRPAQTLGDGKYRITIVGQSNYTFNNAVVPPLKNTAGIVFHSGQNVTKDFELKLGPQVAAVVPQPVARDQQLKLTLSTLPTSGNQLIVTPGTFTNGQLDPAKIFEFTPTGAVSDPSNVNLIGVKTSGENTSTLTTKLLNLLRSNFPSLAAASSAGSVITIPYQLANGTSKFVFDLTKVAATAMKLEESQLRTAALDSVDVYFNSAMKTGLAADPGVVTNPKYYQLIATQETGDPTDDLVFQPTSVVYDPVLKKATLKFASNLDQLVTGGTLVGENDAAAKATGAFRLRIGSTFQSVEYDAAQLNNNNNTQTVAVGTADIADTFVGAVAVDLNTGFTAGTLGRSVVLTDQNIDPATWFTNMFPGVPYEPGHRWLPSNQFLGIENHSGAETGAGLNELAYGFPDVYGSFGGTQLHNAITEPQKQRTREIFELFSRYTGVQFYEVANPADAGMWIITGDTRAIAPSYPAGPTGIGGIADGFNAVINGAMNWGSSEFGGGWFQVAMHEIAHNLGYAHSGDTAPLTVMNGGNESVGPDLSNEPVYPGDVDIIHGQAISRPDSNDIDLYRFQLTEAGTVSVETIAQRMADASLLNSVITLYDSSKNVIARNDDYYGKDAFVSLHLNPGTYYVAITSSGNESFNPEIDKSGLGGTTWGVYDLRINFDPDRADYLLNAAGTALDGNADGKPGEEFNYWFNVQPASRTIYVDKTAPTAGANGTLANPYNTIPAAMTKAATLSPADGQEVVVRLLSNMAFNDNPSVPSSLKDNVPYEIGKYQGNILSDGEKLEIPKAVTLVVDAGVVMKFHAADIDVGSSAQGLDRSLGALQVLGTPQNRTYFTAYRDETLGKDSNLLATTPSKGDWGGLVFRNKQDTLAGRTVRETEGIFLNFVNYADIRYGGGSVKVTGTADAAYAPIHLVEARPTISNSLIQNNSDAGVSADPNSFAESEFQGRSYTADYTRVGPEIHGNLLYNNGMNGLLVRIVDINNNLNSADYGKPLDRVDVPARFDDLDIVHVISGNLLLHGSPGGAMFVRGDSNLYQVADRSINVPNGGGGFQDRQTFTVSDVDRKVTFEFDLDGNGVTPGNRQVFFTRGDSAATIAATIRDAINLARTALGLNIVATLNGTTVDLDGPTVTLGGLTRMQNRMNGRLNIDPGTVVKLNGGRIEVEFEGQLVAEGDAGFPVVFTSLFDDRYGTGGTFDTGSDGQTRSGAAGDWGGIYFSPFAQGSIDRDRIFYAGGNTTIEGGHANFNPVEIRQAEVRVTNTLFQDNESGGAGDRNGRGFTGAATIYVRGAQPIIAGNVFRDNQGATISINVNALNATVVTDWGRQIGGNPNPLDPQVTGLDAFSTYADNHGPLIRENRMEGNQTNGMEVRGATLATESIWDDTDIVHVLTSQVKVPNFHTYGGLRLQSSASESLVVKLAGSGGFLAYGNGMEYEDRIGGTIQIVGTPGHPVVLTALADDTVGAGLQPDGMPQFDTDNANLTPQPGAWDSITFEKLSNDRNVGVANEAEQAAGAARDTNGLSTDDAQLLGYLAQSDEGGDEKDRLGYEVHGAIRADAPADADIYKFLAYPGSEVWFDIDRTSFELDTVLELIDGDGNLVAWSNNSDAETASVTNSGDYSNQLTGQGLARRMPRGAGTGAASTTDYYGINFRDAGMRVVLPGDFSTQQQQLPYYIRVRAAVAMLQALAGNQLADHSTFNIGNMLKTTDAGYAAVYDAATNLARVGKVFEFVDRTTNLLNDKLDPNAIAIYYTTGDSRADIAAKVAAAITAAGLDITATRLDETRPGAAGIEGDQITLTGNLVSFTAGTSGLTQLNPTGVYQLQIRTRELQEYPGSTVQGAYVAYATNGIEALGVPYHTPLAGETAFIPGHNTAGNSQQLGNLLTTDRETLLTSGYLAGAGDIQFYNVNLKLTQVQKIGGVSAGGTRWPVTFDVDFADGLTRPDTSLWVFDDSGKLLLIGTNSNVEDDQPQATQGHNLDDPTRGSAGINDPYIGPVYMVEDASYNVAVTTQGRVPTVMSEQLLRREPVNSVRRIAEDHLQDILGTGPTYNGSGLAVGAEYHLFNNGGVVNLNLSADPYNLTDVTLFTNTTGDLYTNNSFTGVQEVDVTGIYTDLPFQGGTRGYNDIGMRDDGKLYTINGPTFDGSGGSYIRLDTGNGTHVSTNSLGITTHQIQWSNATPPTPTLVGYDGGITFQALTHSHEGGTANRWVWAAGSIVGNPTGATVTRNLLYVLDANGRAIQYPDEALGSGVIGDRGARLASNIVPFAELVSGSQLIVSAATQTTGPYNEIMAPVRHSQYDMVDGNTFSIDADGAGGNPATVFQFDFGSDYRLTAAGTHDVRDGTTWVVHTNNGQQQTFELNSGRVLVLPDASGINTNDRFIVRGAIGAGITYTFLKDFVGTPGPNSILITSGQNADDIRQAVEAAVNANQATSLVTAGGFTVSPAVARISFVGDRQQETAGNEGVAIVNGTGISISGSYAFGGIAIPFEEVDGLGGSTAFLVSMQGVIEGNFTGYAPGWVSYAVLNPTLPNNYGDRISLMNADVVTITPPGGGFSGFYQVGTYGTGANVRVPVGAGYFANQVGQSMVNVINAQGLATSAGTLSGAVFGSAISFTNLGTAVVSESLDTLNWKVAGGAGGNITGLAVYENRLYAVDDAGGLYVVDYLNPTEHVQDRGHGGSWGFVPVDPNGGIKNWAKKTGTGLPTLRAIDTFQYGNQPIHFTGLSLGPQTVENGKFANMLFATDDQGRIFALDPNSPTLGFLEQVYVDGQQTVDTGPSKAGLAFSNIDYNLWHATYYRSGETGHGINAGWDSSRDASAGATSFYFGIDDPRNIQAISNQYNATNYQYDNAAVYGTYDAPGGAQGTLTTNTFSLKGYTFDDRPVLYFNYLAQGEDSTTWDGARAYISDDGVNWDLIATNTDMDDRNIGIGDQVDLNLGVQLTADDKWRQARIDLSNYLGLDNLRLRFTFSTANDFEVGSQNLTGSYLRSLPGYQLTDGQTFRLNQGQAASAETFEFVMGYALQVPNIAGHLIQEGDSFQIRSAAGMVTFVFTKDAANPNLVTPPAGFRYIYIKDNDPLDPTSTADSQYTVANKIVAAIQASGLNIAPFVLQDDRGDTYEDLVFLPGAYGAGATGTRIVTGTALALTGNDPARTLLPGYTNRPIYVTPDMTEQEVADAMMAVVDPLFPNSFKQQLLPTGVNERPDSGSAYKQLVSPQIRVIGHTLTQGGNPRHRLPYGTSLQGDNPLQKIIDETGDRFTHYHRGQRNNYHGFYIDDVIIGFAERGEMVTGAFNVSTSFVAQDPGKAIVAGYYQMEIRRGEEYGSYAFVPPPPVLALSSTFDSNDRLSPGWSIRVPSAGEIPHGLTFQITDGVNRYTFQFLDSAQGGIGGGGGIPIYFTQDLSDAAMADLIAATINNADITLTATVHGGIDDYRVDVDGATWIQPSDDYTAGTNVYGNNWTQGIGSYRFGNSDKQPLNGENRYRDQGQLLLQGNTVVNSANYAIAVGPSQLYPTESFPQDGGVLPLDVPNNDKLVPGVVIANNVLAYNQTGGISFSGDPNRTNPYAPVPFGRIVNNTIYGSPVDNAQSAYNIEVVFTGGLTSTQQAIFDAAARRWERIITADVPDVQTANGLIDDLVIDASGANIDGPGGILGQAGPNGLRNGSFLPYTGGMRFDTADLAAMEQNGSLLDVITHEMGHVLGIGTIWGLKGLLTGAGGADPQFTGAGAAAEYSQKFNLQASSVPVENTGGGGTRDAHWRESIFNNELMTGWINSGSNPLSRITAASLGDLGYQVSLVAADAYLYALGGGNDTRLTGTVQLLTNFTFANAVNAAGAPAGVGISVTNYASPTMLNNIFANLATGVSVDGTSSKSKLGESVYQNVLNLHPGVADNFDIVLPATDPLFVNPDPEYANFYLARGSKAIDSAIDKLDDRPELFVVRNPVGLPRSDIYAPEYDLNGKLRLRDSDPHDTWPGLGTNIWKDRGAIERADHDGPTSFVANPVDDFYNANNPRDPLNDLKVGADDVVLVGAVLNNFEIQLVDQGGMGIDDKLVNAGTLRLLRDGVELASGADYFFFYNPVNDKITLAPATGNWAQGFTYTIFLDNTTTGIRDLAGNPIVPNRTDGTTMFTITLAGLDFGDAPDPYPSRLIQDGARHIVIPDVRLGDGTVDSETDARTVDASDDGVVFENDNVGLLSGAAGSTKTIYVTASTAGVLDAWIDFDHSGTWEPGEKIAFYDATSTLVAQLQPGRNELHFAVPAGLTNGNTWARFRFSLLGGLQPTGEAPNGEVEDYQVKIIPYEEDFGDAPMSVDNSHTISATVNGVSGTQAASHRMGPLYLGLDIDSELDGNPTARADGDDTVGRDDEEGIDLSQAFLIPGTDTEIVATVSGGSGVLDAWIDWNGDGDWNDTVGGVNEKLAFLNVVNGAVVAGPNTLRFTVPDDPQVAIGQPVYARFRLTAAGIANPFGFGGDGEVEDYRVTIITSAVDFGDAPETTGLYHTTTANDPAAHLLNSTLRLGAKVDYETDGLPDANAQGDDDDNIADEDGITLYSDAGVAGEIRAGQWAEVEVAAATTPGGWLQGWIDFDGDGWEASEEIVNQYIDAAFLAGTRRIRFNVPLPTDSAAVTGDVFARFRYSTTTVTVGSVTKGGLSFDGPVVDWNDVNSINSTLPDGEVEDYKLTQQIGTAKITGTKFDDRNANGVRDRGLYNDPSTTINWPGATTTVTMSGNVSAAQSFGFDFEFYGKRYQTFYISRNGFISLGTSQTTLSGAFPQPEPIIAPFGTNVIGGTGTVTVNFIASNERGHKAVQITWSRVRDAQNHENTFSVYIENDPAGDLVAFKYDLLGWAGTNPATQIGFNAGGMGRYDLAMTSPTQAGLANLLAPSTWQYRFDPATGMPLGSESGLAGRSIYLDMDGNHAWTPGVDKEAVTLADDPLTVADETGYYEFVGLFAGQAYEVRERVDAGWLQSTPNAIGALRAVAGDWAPNPNPTNQSLEGKTFTIKVGTNQKVFEFNSVGGVGANRTPVPFTANDTAAIIAQAIAAAINGANIPTSIPNTLVRVSAVEDLVVFGGLDPNVSYIPGANNPMTVLLPYAYSFTLTDQQTVSGVDFGNYRQSRVSVSDVSVAEGSDGLWHDVTLTLHQYDSFGAPVTVSYSTQDGTAVGVADENQTNGDYVTVTNGTFTFSPSGVPLSSLDVRRLTENSQNDFDYSVSENYLVWEERVGSDWEVFLYEENPMTHEGTTKRLSNVSSDNRGARVFYDKTTGLGNVVWYGKPLGESDYEIYRYQIGGLGAVERLTTNSFDDRGPDVGSRYITWYTSESGGKQRIFAYDMSAAVPTAAPISAAAINLNYAPTTVGNSIIWAASDGSDDEIFLYNGSLLRLTTNSTTEQNPQVDGNYAVWETNEGGDREIVLYNIATGQSVRTANATTDELPQISGNNLVWQAGTAGASTIEYVDLSKLAWTVPLGGTLPALVSRQNLSGSQLNAKLPQISGNRVAWQALVGTGQSEVYYREIGSDTLPQNVSNNGGQNNNPQISSEMIVWRTDHGTTSFEVYRARVMPAERTATVTLRVYGDLLVENDETFLVNFSNPLLANLDDSQATVRIVNDDGAFDAGDALGALLPTLNRDNGARHMLQQIPGGPAYTAGLYLGNGTGAPDAEADGQPNAAATGDDTVGSDDEGGVVLVGGNLIRGTQVQLQISVAKPAALGTAYLDAWIDWDGDGQWEAGEKLAKTLVGDHIPVTAGVNTLNVDVPLDAKLGSLAARFRLSSSFAPLSDGGLATDGEVEDYAFPVVAPVRQVGDKVYVTGTGIDDVFQFETVGAKLIVTLNGVVYKFDDATVATIDFDGAAHINGDQVTFVGTSAAETAELWSDHGTFTTPGVVVTTINSEKFTAISGGNLADKVTLHGTSGNDTFTTVSGSPQFTNLPNVIATGFANVVAKGEGGSDTATLTGTAGNDTLDATWNVSKLYIAGQYSHEVDDFYKVLVNDSAGTDSATFTDDKTANHARVAVDVFSATIRSAVLAGTAPTAYSIDARGFDNIVAVAHNDVVTVGATVTYDVARLYDTQYVDTFKAWPNRAELTVAGQAYNVTANGFRSITINEDPSAPHVATDLDRAELHGGSSLSDKFAGYPDLFKYTLDSWATRTTPTYAIGVSKFEIIEAEGGNNGANAAADQALLYTRNGVVDRLNQTVIAASGKTMTRSTLSDGAYSGGTLTGSLYAGAALAGGTYAMGVNGFGKTTVYSGAAEADVAILNGTTADDVLYVNKQGIDDVMLYRTTVSFNVETRNFKNITVNGNGGPDKAYVYDSSSTNPDKLVIRQNAAPLQNVFEMTQGNGPVTKAYGFPNVTASSTRSTAAVKDELWIYGAAGVQDTFAADPTKATLQGKVGGTQVYYISAGGFKKVVAEGNDSDSLDSARLVDRNGADRLFDYRDTSGVARLQLKDATAAESYLLDIARFRAAAANSAYRADGDRKVLQGIYANLNVLGTWEL